MASRRASTIWQTVHDERYALIEDLKRLTPAEWRTPSLCAGWDVHDVLAHLVDSAKTTRLVFMRRMVASGFDFDRDNARGVARERADDPLDTLAAFRAEAENRSTPPASLATRLVEAFVHGEDIRRPLGIRRGYSSSRAAIALSYQVRTSTKMGGGKELAAGCRLVATDTSFHHGDGLEVRGSAISLLLAVSGRPVAPEELIGPGHDHLLGWGRHQT